MDIALYFRIDPVSWDAVAQGAIQYDPRGVWSDLPDWELIPHGTFAIIAGHGTSPKAPASARGDWGTLDRGIVAYPLDFADWLAGSLSELAGDEEAELTYVPQGHEFKLDFKCVGDRIDIIATDAATGSLSCSRAEFLAAAETGLRALMRQIAERAPALLAWPSFETLLAFAPEADAVAYLPAPKCRRPPDWEPLPVRGVAGAIDELPAFRVEWSLDEAAYATLANRRATIARGSYEDMDGILLREAAGWLRFTGGALEEIPRGEVDVLGDWVANSYHPNFRPAASVFAVGACGSVLGLAEYLGWLLEMHPFPLVPGRYSREYLDPLEGYRVRFAHDEFGYVSVMTDRFADRGYRRRMPAESFIAGAVEFVVAVEAGIKERLPSLYDLVSFSFVRPPTER